MRPHLRTKNIVQNEERDPLSASSVAKFRGWVFSVVTFEGNMEFLQEACVYMEPIRYPNTKKKAQARTSFGNLGELTSQVSIYQWQTAALSTEHPLPSIS